MATGQVGYDSFRVAALAEQGPQIAAAATAKRHAEAEACARMAGLRERSNRVMEQLREKAKRAKERAEVDRIARERDPRYIAKLEQRELRERYGIDTFVDAECFPRLMAILRQVDVGQRVSEDDFVWLSTTGKNYFSKELWVAYHRLEAEHYVEEFKRTTDPWAAVNASGHLRKCNRSPDAEALLCAIRVEDQKIAKLKSALCTTRGGVMRDLGRLTDARRLGEQAHAFMPDDFRPCTLLGAVHVEMGNYSLGQEWFAKAVERGASEASVDQDLRHIFFRAEPAKQAALREFLLRQDPIRYAWVASKADQKRTARDGLQRSSRR